MTKGNIRLYTTESEYLLEKDSLELPNVSFVEGNKAVFYNQAPPSPWKDLSDGVYAIGADGNPVMAEDVDESCIGVALISGDQRFAVTNEDATDGTTTSLYWGYNLYDKDVAGIAETTDESTARADYNGKANTAAIINAYAEHSVEMNSLDMCKILQDFNAVKNEDWYVPAEGQLGMIYDRAYEMNKILTVIGGVEINRMSAYASSSEYNAEYGWGIIFAYGYKDYRQKNQPRLVRFIRDLV